MADQYGPLAFLPAVATDEQRADARTSDLYARGDMRLGWVNEGDLCALAFADQSNADRMRELEAALEPFSKYADAILRRRDGAQDEPVAVDRLVFGIDGQHVTIGDLRRARATLSKDKS